MTKVIWILILCSTWLTRAGAFAQVCSPLIVRLEMNTPTVKKFDDLELDIIFTNINSPKPIYLLDGFLYGFSNLDSIREPDVFVQLEMIEKKRYLRQENRIENHGIRGYGMNYDTLELGKTMIRQFKLGPYFSFKKGAYRVRVIYYFPKETATEIKNVYSDWLYFNVVSTIN